MDTVYLICLIVGGFFTLLSIFSGGDTEADADADFDVDADADLDIDADADVDLDADADLDAETAAEVGAGPGFLDLLSFRALLLFATFFGLTGTLFSLTDTGEPMTALYATLMGVIAGLGGNYVIKRFAYAHVSSAVGMSDLHGHTGRVLLPFGAGEKGKIVLEVKGKRLQLIARSEEDRPFNRNDQVVVVRMDGNVAEVVKPD